MYHGCHLFVAIVTVDMLRCVAYRELLEQPLKLLHVIIL